MKIRIRRITSDGFTEVVDIKTDGQDFYEEVMAKRAKQFVERWNAFEKGGLIADLLTTLNNALRVILQSENVPYKDETLTEINQAIAKAELS